MTRRLTSLVSAAEVALGIDIDIIGRRAAHYAPEVSEAYWLTRADLIHAVACAGDSDAYSLWCQTTGRRMADRTRIAVYGR